MIIHICHERFQCFIFQSKQSNTHTCIHTYVYIYILHIVSLKSKDDQLIISLGFTEIQLQKFKLDTPNDVMRRFHRANIIDLSNYLQDRFNYTKIDMQKLVLSRPYILAYTINKLRMSVDYLHHDLGLSTVAISAMIKRNPMILACSTSKIQPLVKFLRDEIGNTDWQRIISKNSQLFFYSIEKNLRPKVSSSRLLYELPFISPFCFGQKRHSNNVNTTCVFVCVFLDTNKYHSPNSCMSFYVYKEYQIFHLLSLVSRPFFG